MVHPFRSSAGKDKAAKAAKAVKKSQWKKSRKPRYSTTFHRPRTLIRTRDPKVPRVRYAAVGHVRGIGRTVNSLELV